jgi:hypothetical protein
VGLGGAGGALGRGVWGGGAGRRGGLSQAGEPDPAQGVLRAGRFRPGFRGLAEKRNPQSRFSARLATRSRDSAR